MAKKKCKCKKEEKKGYIYITGTPHDVAGMKNTIDSWLDDGYGIPITLIGVPLTPTCGVAGKPPC